MHKFFNIILLGLCMFFLTACDSGKAVITSGSYYEQTHEGVGDTSEALEKEDIEENTLLWDGSNVVSDDAGMETEFAVHVCGAVKCPDVYMLKKGAIKQDALLAAGGFDEGAAIDYVNLAEPVKSGEKIYFPYEDELENGIFIRETEADVSEGLININTADKNMLMTLPGIGEKRAQDILDYREQYGGFSSIEDIKNVKGIKESVYNNIKDIICVR
ncbi:MAG: ComEA family DNA-binding protein [Lachnospiraceae bacterium]|nr:ComEA family DNA-binding protein [Lachnospiraceae bacterium]